MRIIDVEPNDALLADVLDVVLHLRTHRTHAELRQLYTDGYRDSGYRIVALFEGDECQAAAGYRIGTNFASGKYLYVDDLVTRDDQRSNGYGAALLAHVKRVARDAGCVVFSLDSGTHRRAAHRFYFREGLEITSFHFELPMEIE